MIRVRVLGPLEAEVNGHAVDLGGPRQRAVLALLVAARGDVVPVDRLIDDLWRGEPPPRATGALQAYVSNLRRALEPDRPPRAPATVLVSVPPGYAVRLPADAVDAWRFEALVRGSGGASDPAGVRARLEQALGLWRGPAYAEVAAEPWAAAGPSASGPPSTPPAPRR